MSIKSYCWFQYWNGEREFWEDDCFCGSKKEQFSIIHNGNYCCVHQNSPSVNNCQIDTFTNEKWCPNATLLAKTHICNNNCYFSFAEICPSNAKACMDWSSACDGRERCEAFCTGPLENFPYYNLTTKSCVGDHSSITSSKR